MQRMICCCCGEAAYGKQWWNRDTGFSLCVSCADRQEKTETPEDMHRMYGDRGVHYASVPKKTAVKRYALVYPRHNGIDPEVVARYLPLNYKVIWTGDEGVVIAGRDNHGWTLDAYVIPRLGSGLMRAEEIDLSHPVMLKIPA